MDSRIKCVSNVEKVELRFLHNKQKIFLGSVTHLILGFSFGGHSITTLESGINIGVRLLIFEVFSRSYVLIKGGYVY